MKLPAQMLEFFREQGAKGGKLSAEARMKKLTPEKRSEIARNAVAAREAKRKAAEKKPTKRAKKKKKVD
jgi:hypothetical protein